MVILKASINLYSTENGEIQRFLTSFYNKKIKLDNDLKWNTEFENPIEISDMIGTFIENNDKFKINMWLSLDKDIFINVTDVNADSLIRYIYERYPW